MATRKLIFGKHELSDQSCQFLLEHSLMMQDYRSFWMDRYALADDEKPGIFVDENDEVQVGEEFWTALGLPDEMKAEIIAFWEKHPDGQIEWEA